MLELLFLDEMELRFAMYHTVDLPGSDQTQGVTHAIMAFANSSLFNTESPAQFEPFEPLDKTRKRFRPGTKVMIAIEGWGDTSGFSEGAKDEASRTRYAKNVAAMVNSLGFDGVDIDWEYPGGNGDDYRRVPNCKKISEIESYPLFLQAIRQAIGPNKLLSIAVPGKRTDMIAFTKEQGPKLWPSVDMVNIMSYDLMNRRAKVTNHHTSVMGSLDSIKAYEESGLDTTKINLGFAYYAKWFMTDPSSNCSEHPVGCAVVNLESPDGTDSGKSGVLTLEKSNMDTAPVNLTVSTDGTCGFAKGTRCPVNSYCSQYGNCGPWSIIFSKEDWLNKVSELGGTPALISSQLSDVCSSRRNRQIHMLLLTNFERDNVPSESLRQLFFACLKPGYTHMHRQKGWGSDEIKVGNITVDVTQPLHGGAWLEIRARRIKQLFISEHKLLQSQYCFFYDRRIRALQSQNFISAEKEIIATKRDLLSRGVILNIPCTKRVLRVLVFADRGEF